MHLALSYTNMYMYKENKRLQIQVPFALPVSGCTKINIYIVDCSVPIVAVPENPQPTTYILSQCTKIVYYYYLHYSLKDEE